MRTKQKQANLPDRLAVYLRTPATERPRPTRCYPNHFEQKIGFTTLREQLEATCLSALGRHYVARMEFQTRHESPC
ncbi:MAG: hypothetical protein WKG07_29015 [Hymenobacter sp.]